MSEPPASSNDDINAESLPFDHEDGLRRAAERGDLEALKQLGLMLVGEGETDAARKWLELAVRGGDVEAINGLGLLLERVGDLEAARVVFREGADAGDQTALANLRRLVDPEGELASSLESDLRADFADQQSVQADPDKSAQPNSASGDSAGAFSLAAGAVSDLPSAEDLLGFSPLVEGLRALLNVRRTTLPLAIAIAAPWGAGKSSVMLQLRKLLREPGTRQPQERSWWTVSFPAWKYEHSERLWAALAKAIYEQPQEEMSIAERIWFRVRVEWARLGWRKFLLKGLWPPLAAAGAVIVALAASTDLGGAGTPLAAVVSSLAAFSLSAAHYWGLASMPFKRAMERYASAPDYDHQLGFTADADRDISSLARVLAPDTVEDPRALAVFVDDLDRCTSGHVVEVVEAMNQIFNSDGRHGCVFVLGLDREVVATSIEVAYGEIVKSLREADRPVGQDFGMHFLAKLVQLVVTVPEPSAQSIERLLGRITGNRLPAPAPAVDSEDVERVEREIREQAPEGLAEVASTSPAANASQEVVEESQRRVRAERIEDSPEVISAEFKVLKRLSPNPRQVKRFDNAFRLQLYVANEDRDGKLDFSHDQLVALGKWVALRLRWPALAEILDDEPELIWTIETSANGGEWAEPDFERSRLVESYERWFEDREVRAFLREEDSDGARRISSLDLSDFPRVS